MHEQYITNVIYTDVNMGVLSFNLHKIGMTLVFALHLLRNTVQLRRILFEHTSG